MDTIKVATSVDGYDLMSDGYIQKDGVEVGKIKLVAKTRKRRPNLLDATGLIAEQFAKNVVGKQLDS